MGKNILRSLLLLLPLCVEIMTADIIQPRTLVSTHGSGNWGEGGSAAYYTIDRLPSALLAMSENDHSQSLVRRDIDLGPNGTAFVIDNVLTPTEADALSACSEAIFKLNGNSRFAPGIQTPPGMRQNMAAHWFSGPTTQAEAQLFAPLYARFKHLLPNTVAGRPLFGQLNQKLAVFKYEAQDQFTPHHDGTFPGHGMSEDGAGVERWDGVDSGLSMLLYLNDADAPGVTGEFVGGATRLFRMGTHPKDGQYVDVPPRKGSALFFRHGSGLDSVF